MKTLIKRFNTVCLTSGVAALTVLSGGNSSAAALDLSDVPLFLTSGATPNLIMAIDDSSSMDNEVLLPTNDAAAWWRTNDDSDDCLAGTGNSFVGCGTNGDATRDIPQTGRLNFNTDGAANTTWKKYVYLFPNGFDSDDDSFRRRTSDSTNDHFAIPPIPTFAWARAAAHNPAYFNPLVSYSPWPNGGGYTFANSSKTAARFDPVFGTATDAIDLTKDRAGESSIDTTATCDSSIAAPQDNHYFKVYRGMVVPTGTCMRVAGAATGNRFSSWNPSTIEITVGAGTATDAEFIGSGARVAIRYFPATFYLPTGTTLPTDYGWLSGATKVAAGKAPNGDNLDGYELKRANFSDDATYEAAIQNFANWFTYYRKRHQALRAGLGQSFEDLNDLRIGGFTINNRQDVTMRDIGVDANRTALYQQFYHDWSGTGGTPNRAAVAKIVSNYKRTGSSAPIQLTCQKNFGMLFTDGFSNAPASGDGFDAVGNVDGTRGAPYADSTSNTMADGVMNAYVTNLRPDLTVGQVKVPVACDSPSPDAKLDCNKNLHMNFYAVTLGARGVQFDSDNPVDPYVTSVTWPSAFFPRHPSAVDDLWHAAINGRGQLLNAKSPREISEKLSEVLSSVTEKTSSASSATVNSGSVNSSSRVYQAKFSSKDWSGQLLSYKVKSDGTLEALPEWDAAEELPSDTARKIFTMGSTGTRIAFSWDDIQSDTVRKAQLGTTDTEARAVLEYIRGSAANESDTGYRARASKLGDLVNSSPTFVGAPAFFYSDSFEAGGKYSDFRIAQKDRVGAVYVGGNDGMLHAFHGENGTELFAFIPSTVFANLKLLTQQNYAHKYFVDGSPNVGDVFTGGSWRTVLIGGLNRGGQAVYALDVTTPNSFSASDVLWEFTDRSEPDSSDLGFTFSKPAIVKLADGNWGAVFGNGYNSTVNDGAVGSGEAVLFIVNIANGKIIRKISTKQGDTTTPNGLATPVVVDINGDSIADYAFAGDLRGNLWKFNIRDSDHDNWRVAYGTADAPVPLYVAKNDSDVAQPITGRPEVARGPGGNGMIVLFGTGKYLEESDKFNTSAQSFYGIVDPNQGSSDALTGRDSLAGQTIVAEVQMPSSGPRVRITSTLGSGTRGWYLDLVTPPSATQEGERVVSNPIYRDGRIIFTTLIPKTNPCDSGGESWIMELDALTGGRLGTSPFDINRDGKIDATDIATWLEGEDSTKGLVSGIMSEVGIAPEPGILADPERPVEYKYTAGSLGNIQVVTESANAKSFGRQSWRSVK